MQGARWWYAQLCGRQVPIFLRYGDELRRHVRRRDEERNELWHVRQSMRVTILLRWSVFQPADRPEQLRQLRKGLHRSREWQRHLQRWELPIYVRRGHAPLQ